jgi:hypothetical protein
VQNQNATHNLKEDFMRINPKLFTLSLVLATVLTATSAVAATQTATRDDRGSNVITRIIEAIKRHFVWTTGDGIIIPPPESSR